MANTPIYNWSTPDNTGLVKNGALDIRTLGNAIDTTMATMTPKAIVDAKGDLIAATANDTPARLAVGANGETLVADSSTSTGLDWKTATEQYPWQNYTPNYVNFTVGNATVISRYQQIGKLVNVFVRITWGSTTSSGNYPIVSYPVSPARTLFFCGDATLRDIGSADYLGRIFADNTGLLFVTEYTGANWNTFGVLTATDPVTWTTGDVWTMIATYEAA